MSTFAPYTATCPACWHEWSVSLAQGLHITRLPHVRAQLLDGTFQVHRCPACNAPAVFESTMVYTDFDRHEFVAVEASAADNRTAAIERCQDVFAECFDGGPPMAREEGARFKRRLVYGLRALREKIMLWDAGLDDRVVEAVKGDLLRDADESPHDLVLRISRVLDGGHLMFAAHEPLRWPTGIPRDRTWIGKLDPPQDFITAPASAYAARAAAPSSITADFPWLSDDWLVDLHCALPPGPSPAGLSGWQKVGGLLP